MCLLSSLAVAACPAGGHAQTDWYVDVNGTPPGAGTQANPWTSIQDAIDQMPPGEGNTIWVAPGEYVNDSIHVPEGLYITVRCTGGPLMTSLIPPAGEWALSTQWSGVLWLHGLHVRTPGSAASIVSARLYRCILEHTGPYLASTLGVDNLDNARLENCTVTGFGKGVKEFALGVFGDLYLNTLFYGNGSDMTSFNGQATTEYCSYQSGHPYLPVGNIVGKDPQLWDLAGSDFHLAPLSHCIDAGDPSMLDPDGSRIDIGAICPYDATYAPAPTTYCTPKVNSLGCAPLVSWSGAPSLTGLDDFVLTAQPALNHKIGKFIWGTAPAAGHFLGGTLCVKPPFVRGPLIDSGGSASGSDCTGSYLWHFSQTYMASQGLTAGTIVYAQAWGRDPGFAEPQNSQLSDAIVFQILP